MSEANDGMDDEVCAQDNQTGVQDEKRHEQAHDTENVVKAGGGNEDAENGEGQGQNRNPSTQGGQSCPFFGKNQLDLIKNKVVDMGWFYILWWIFVVHVI
ncbi:MAG: hypothetical protein JWQ71_4708 [Pedosphaera sp.]|nr:hypothetical protein [Pedosphaera sp.]